MRPEHTFPDKLEDWDKIIFENANHFTVFRRLGRFNRDTHSFATFPEAVAYAGEDKTALVYAVCASGRSACMIRKRWLEYLAMI